MATRLYLRDTTAIGLDGRKDLAASNGSSTQTSTLTGPAAANTVFPGMRFVSGRMPSGGVDFAGATVSIAIGGSETSPPLNAAAQFRIRSRAPDGAFADFLVRPAVADLIDALEGRDDLFVMGDDDDGGLVLDGHPVEDAHHSQRAL